MSTQGRDQNFPGSGDLEKKLTEYRGSGILSSGKKRDRNKTVAKRVQEMGIKTTGAELAAESASKYEMEGGTL